MLPQNNGEEMSTSRQEENQSWQHKAALAARPQAPMAEPMLFDYPPMVAPAIEPDARSAPVAPLGPGRAISDRPSRSTRLARGCTATALVAGVCRLFGQHPVVGGPALQLPAMWLRRGDPVASPRHDRVPLVLPGLLCYRPGFPAGGGSAGRAGEDMPVRQHPIPRCIDSQWPVGSP